VTCYDENIRVVKANDKDAITQKMRREIREALKGIRK